MCFNVTLLDNRNRLLEITVPYVRVRDFPNESPLSSFLPLPGNFFCCSLLPTKVITLFLCSLCSALLLVSPAVLHYLISLCLHFAICKMGTIIVPISWGCCVG